MHIRLRRSYGRDKDLTDQNVTKVSTSRVIEMDLCLAKSAIAGDKIDEVPIKVAP